MTTPTPSASQGVELAVHPEAVSGHPEVMRWVINTGDLPVGTIQCVPGPLGELVESGVLERVCVERGAVWTWREPSTEWATVGAQVRSAVSRSVGCEGWRSQSASDDFLLLVARDLVEGELATYISSHGGVISVEGAAGGVVTIDFGGACENCPAAGHTLHDRIEARLKERFPDLVEVRRAQSSSQQAGATRARRKSFLGIPLLRPVRTSSSGCGCS